MKKACLILLGNILFFTLKGRAQLTPCTNRVNVEVTAPNPQSGSYNYFGIKVTLDQGYSSDVTVAGYIHDVGDENNTSHPFEVVVYASNTSNETVNNFYQTGPTSSVN